MCGLQKPGLRVTEVPSFETVRHFGASNLNAFSDGLRVLRTIHAERKGVFTKRCQGFPVGRTKNGSIVGAVIHRK